MGLSLLFASALPENPTKTGNLMLKKFYWWMWRKMKPKILFPKSWNFCHVFVLSNKILHFKMSLVHHYFLYTIILQNKLLNWEENITPLREKKTKFLKNFQMLFHRNLFCISKSSKLNNTMKNLLRNKFLKSSILLEEC